MRAVSTLFVLAAAWLLLSGHYSQETFILILGVLSCLTVLVVARLLRRADARRSQPGRELPPAAGLRLLAYLPWLAIQIVRANLHVARLILDPAMPIAPRLLRVRANQETSLAQVVHANSITLTPGTITLDLRRGELLVHALDEVSATGVEQGEIDRRVTRVEGRSVV